ncbi:sugar kinase [Aliihoeflea aestuarii]|jgi:2-dehydro-3-deoxygluconokinase|uniref:sugar kinase n=1 Tax=Aliihoeflea aestuarii TaxID=453840 RepID=UPI002093F983|nr:sugar kinase [Aliihoeflea aestuarii]MCO6390811.1 sugar kinase [Aliihoeflea aestuarii]
MSGHFLSIGEAMIEMAGGSQGNWNMGVAGDTLNTAWYARRHLGADWRVSYFTALGEDRYSGTIRDFIDGAGIETGLIATIPERRPGLYFIHQENGDRHFTYWRDASAARLLARDRSALANAISAVDVVYFSGITLAILSDTDRRAFLDVLGASVSRGTRVAFDPNIRPSLWRDEDEMRHWLMEGARVSTIALPTFGDEAQLFGDDDPAATAVRYRAAGVSEIVVKNGRQPAYVDTGQRCFKVGAQEVENVVDATGAGDSFNGAYLAARLTGEDAREAAVKGHRTAATCLASHGALIG